MDIDFVITWVDMDDPEWQRSFAECAGRSASEKNSVSAARFRDYGFLRYWFRGVENFAPWVNKIHFVTCGQKPNWLNVNHPKLKLVNHSDYIPGRFLPCFNSNVLEYYLHKIPELSEQFVYFNDDFFITNDVGVDRFFRNGLPCDIAAFRFNSDMSQWAKMQRNNLRIINSHFDKKEVTSRFADKWYNKIYGNKARLNYLFKPYDKFLMLRTPHNAQPFLKSTFDKVWATAGTELTKTSSHRFRTGDDLTPELFRMWQVCLGNFEPYNTYDDTKMFPLLIKSKQAVAAVRDQTYKLVCLNDNAHIRNYGSVMKNIQNAFENILTEKSTFEV